jgi:hypothetical protein
MSGQTIVTASLKGMRVVVDGKRCELREYDFQDNRWLPKDEAAWPLPRPLADKWLAGWNHMDRFAVVSVLTESPDYPEEVRRPQKHHAEPHS